MDLGPAGSVDRYSACISGLTFSPQKGGGKIPPLPDKTHTGPLGQSEDRMGGYDRTIIAR
jgi:hypothetical protein